MSAVARVLEAFARPPAGTPIEERVHQLEEALQCLMVVLAATSTPPPERAPERPHLRLVTNTNAENWS